MRFPASYVLLALISIGSAAFSAAQEQAQESPQAQPQGQSEQSQQPAAPAPDSEPQSTSPATPQTQQEEPSHADHPVLKRRPAKKTIHKSQRASTSSGKVIVRNGGAKEGTSQLSLGGKEQTTHNRDNAEQLLATTDANLKSIAGRQLSPAQQSMVEQIHTYIVQSKAATSAGDLSRAHTLAYKARLLSDELARK